MHLDVQGHLPEDRVPDRGDMVDWQTLRLEVMDMDRQRVDQVLVTRLTPPPQQEPENEQRGTAEA